MPAPVDLVARRQTQPAAAVPPSPPVRGRYSVETIVVAVITIFGFRVGARPIRDNSMFTHLRTGVEMVRTGAIPRFDPYSFTAHGKPWVVQSWLAEWTYGVANQLGGLRLVVLEQGVLTGLLAFLLARLARAGSPDRTTAAALVAIGSGVAMWAPRPLLFGLVCLAILVTVVERQRSPWLLVPLAWVWVNTHGSFLLGPAYLGALALGFAVDNKVRPIRSLRYLGTFAVGLAVSAINPLGPRLLVFPLAIESKAAVFRRVVEWRSPDFQRPDGLFTLIFLVIALVILVRVGTRWADLLPVLGFVALGLLAVRNLPSAGVVLAPALGRALRRPDQSGDGGTVGAGFVAVVAVLAVLFAFGVVRDRPVDTHTYPVAAVTFAHDHGLLGPGHRMAHQDLVGNYLELRYGTKANVFVDDRVDMFPVAVSNDYHELLAAAPDPLGVLDRQRVDVVLWSTDKPLVPLLRASGWRPLYDAHGWVILQRP